MKKSSYSQTLGGPSVCPQQHIIDPVRKALDYYTEMDKALDREQPKTAARTRPEPSKPETP